MNKEEQLLFELRMKRRELEVEHRIFMAVKNAREEEWDYLERVISIMAKDISDSSE